MRLAKATTGSSARAETVGPGEGDVTEAEDSADPLCPTPLVEVAKRLTIPPQDLIAHLETKSESEFQSLIEGAVHQG
jgi:hypothetical protein